MTTDKTNNVGFSIGAEKYEDTFDVPLYNPVTDEPYLTPAGEEVTITVYGQDSEHYRRVVNDQQNRRIQKAQRTGGRVNMTAEMIDANALEVLVKCTKGWFGIGDDKGSELEFNEKNAKTLYTSQPHIRDQIDQAMHDRKNFLKNSSGA